MSSARRRPAAVSGRAAAHTAKRCSSDGAERGTWTSSPERTCGLSPTMVWNPMVRSSLIIWRMSSTDPDALMNSGAASIAAKAASSPALSDHVRSGRTRGKRAHSASSTLCARASEWRDVITAPDRQLAGGKHLDAAVGLGIEDECDIDIAAGQQAVRRLHRAHAEDARDTRLGGVELRQHAGQEIGDATLRPGDGDGLAMTVVAANPAQGNVGVPQGTLGVLGENAAGVGQQQPMRGALEQARVELVLEVDDLAVDGRGRDVQPARGKAHGTAPRRLEKVADYRRMQRHRSLAPRVANSLDRCPRVAKINTSGRTASNSDPTNFLRAAVGLQGATREGAGNAACNGESGANT